MEAASETTVEFKANLVVEQKLEAFYTAGDVQSSKNGERLFCFCNGAVKIIAVNTGKLVKTIESEDDPFFTFVYSPDDKILVTASKSGLLKQWNLDDFSLTRTWKSFHKGPIKLMAFDDTVTLLATGGTDGKISVWDIVRRYCTHNLRGASGVFSAVMFHPDTAKGLIVGAADDLRIRVWDLKTSNCEKALEGHFSVVTSIQFTDDMQNMLSSGRDQVVIVWDANNFRLLRTLPVYEAVEGLILLPQGLTFPKINVEDKDRTYFITAGNKGVLKVWTDAGKLLYTQPQNDSRSAVQSGADGTQLLNAFVCRATNMIKVITSEQNIILYNMDDLSMHKQFCGYNDDILDITYWGENDSHFVVATNSNHIKVYEVSTFSCQFLYGHTDVVLSIDKFPKNPLLLASSSKDNTVRIWKMDKETGLVTQVAIGQGHTRAVGAVSCSRSSTKFLVSGSEDSCVKVWDIPQNIFGDGDTLKSSLALSVRWTEVAHEKDINSVCVSPNDKLLASGSRDKLVKVWLTATGQLVAALRGHQRGVWCVRFSPVDQVVASSSADNTIKIWSLSDFTCVKTFEGHAKSVLKFVFVSRGMQLVSSDSDGLLKLWTIKLNECIKTFDGHEGRVWALAVNNQEDYVISGAADSNVLIWKDTTETEKQEIIAKEEELLLQEQTLNNLLQQKKYLKALRLTIRLEQPFRTLTILKDLFMEPDGPHQIEELLMKLNEGNIDALLRFVMSWNQNSKHCFEAQKVLNLLLKSHRPEQLLAMPSMKSNLQGLLPYTDRHYQRLSRLLQQATFAEYTWQRMKMSDMDTITSIEKIESLGENVVHMGDE